MLLLLELLRILRDRTAGFPCEDLLPCSCGNSLGSPVFWATVVVAFHLHGLPNRLYRYRIAEGIGMTLKVHLCWFYMLSSHFPGRVGCWTACATMLIILGENFLAISFFISIVLSTVSKARAISRKMTYMCFLLVSCFLICLSFAAWSLARLISEQRSSML